MERKQQQGFVKLLKLAEYQLPDITGTKLGYIMLGEKQNYHPGSDGKPLGSNKVGYDTYRRYEALGDAIWGLVVQHLRFEYGLNKEDLSELESNKFQGSNFRRIGACEELETTFYKTVDGKQERKPEGHCSGRLEAVIGLLYDKLTSEDSKKNPMYLITHWLYNILGLREIATSKFRGLRGKTARDLNQQYNDLVEQYRDLVERYNDLDQQYDDLNQRYREVRSHSQERSSRRYQPYPEQGRRSIRHGKDNNSRSYYRR